MRGVKAALLLAPLVAAISCSTIEPPGRYANPHGDYFPPAPSAAVAGAPWPHDPMSVDNRIGVEGDLPIERTALRAPELESKEGFEEAQADALPPSPPASSAADSSAGANRSPKYQVANKPSYQPASRPTYQPAFRSCAENGSCYGDFSVLTGRPKTVHVGGYYRKNGTYVRGHFRSKPRR